VLVRLSAARWKRLTVDVLAGSTGFALAFSAFLVAGAFIFPGSNWLATYLEWNSRLDYTVFIGDATTWQRDSALIVVVIAVIAAAIATISQPRHRWAWAALAVSLANIVVTIAMMVVFTGPWLETPTYVAKLWPAALMALVLVFTSMSPGTHEGKQLWQGVTIGGTAIAVPLLLWVGRFDGTLDYRIAWIVALAVMVLVVVTAWYVRGRWNVIAAIVLTLAMAATFVGAQLLQNGRGLLGSYGQYPFRSAFVDFSYGDQMAAKIAVQEWLLANTTREDTIMIWTDPQRLTADVAAMQLWGGDNLVSIDAALSRPDAERLELIKPSVIAMYAPDREQIHAFMAGLPPWSLPTEPACTSVPYLGVGTGEAIACITRLTWIG
jgi:hypothetical protein